MSALDWAPPENVLWSRLVLGQGWACGRITQDRKMQCNGNYFRDKTQLYRKVFNALPGPGRHRGVAGE